MPTVYKVLAQSSPTLNSNVDIYTVPAANSAVISTASISNLTATPAVVSLAIRPAGQTLSNVNYIMRNITVSNNDTLLLTLGTTMAATDVMTANVTTANVSISLFGTEMY